MREPLERTPTSGRCSLDAAAATIWPSTEKLLAEDVFAVIAAQAAAADERGLMSTVVIDRAESPASSNAPRFSGGSVWPIQPSPSR